MRLFLSLYSISTGIIYILFYNLFWLPMLVVSLYLEMSNVVFYEIVTRNLIVENPQGISYSQSPHENGGWQGDAAQGQREEERHDDPDIR